jgi:hypothetical protein
LFPNSPSAFCEGEVPGLLLPLYIAVMARVLWGSRLHFNAVAARVLPRS